MSNRGKVIRDLNTNPSFTKEASALFNKIADNQKNIVAKFNEIEVLIKENTKELSDSKVFTKYINIELK